MLKRRDIIVVPVLAGAAYAAGKLAVRHGADVARHVPGTIGPIVIDEAVVKSLHRTVSDKIRPDQVKGLIELAKRDFPWVLHPLTRTEDFDRKLCTEFIMNSNLIDNGYDITGYEFSEYSGACSPFLYAAP